MLSFLRRLQRRYRSASQRRAVRPLSGWFREPPALLLLEDRVTPTTLHWTGAVDSTWSAAGNWLEGVAPVSGETLVFDTTTAGFAASAAAFAPNDDVSGLTNMSLVINDASAAGDFVIGGDPLGLSTSAAATALASTVSAGSVATVSNALGLGANTTVNVELGALTLSGVVSGGFSLTETGSPAGRLLLNAANTYSGGTVVTSGTVAVNTNTSLGSGTLTLSGGTLGSTTTQNIVLGNTFVVTAPSALSGNASYTMTGNGTLNANLNLVNVYGLTLSGALSGAGGLIENGGAGESRLAGNAANTFTGGTTIYTGVIELDKSPGVQALASPVTIVGSQGGLYLLANNQLNGTVGVSLGNGGLFNMLAYSDSVTALTGTGTLEIQNGLTITGNGAQVVAASVSGSGSITYSGSGSLTLTGRSPGFSGTLTAMPPPPPPTSPPAVPGTLIVNGDYSAATLVATGGQYGGTGAVGAISTTGGTLSPATAGTVGTFTSTGNVTAQGANFQVDLGPRGLSDSLALAPNATFALTNNTLQINVLNSTLGTSFQVITSPTGGLSGVFSNYYNGETFALDGRTFQITYTPRAVTITDLLAAPTTLHWTGAGGSNWSSPGNWQEGAAPVSGDTLVFDTNTNGFAANAAAFAPNDDMVGLTGLSIVINDASTAGDFVIGGNPFGLSATGASALASSATSGTVETINNALSLAANTTVNVELGLLTLGGVISGPYSLTEAGSPVGTLTLTAANTYSGGTVLASGSVLADNNTALGTGLVTLSGGALASDTGTVTLANPFVVTAPSRMGTTAHLALTGNGTLNATLTLKPQGVLTLGGALSGPGGLVQFNSGTTVLAGTAANTFTGGTNVVDGTFELDKTAGINALASGISLGGGGNPVLLWGANNQLNGGVSLSLLGGTVNSNGFSDSVANLNGVGSIDTGTAAAAGLTVTGSGANVLTGTVTDVGLLTYSGTGSLTLAGDSPLYTGNLIAAQGALVVAANFSGASATARAGGTLAGTGIVNTLTAGAGTVSPAGGGAGGIISTAGGSVLASTLAGETFQANLNDLAPSAQLVVGNFATLNLGGATLSANVVNATRGDVFTIVSSATNGIRGTFAGLPDGTIFGISGLAFLIHYTNNAVTLTDLSTIRLTPSIPAAEVGLAYNQTITSTGGTGTVTLAVSNVTNTTGLTISGSGTGTITISGTPATAGTVTFTVTPTDSNGTEPGLVYTIQVNPPVTLSPATLPPGDVGLAYNQTITPSGGGGPVTLAVSGVTNSTGVTISGSGTGTITISGTPTSTGTVSFTVTPTDSVGTSSGHLYSFTVGPALVLTPSTLPTGEVGLAYNQSITTTGGSGPATLAVSGVTNTTGVTISGSGTGTITISGTPTSSGTVTFTVTPTDNAGTGAGRQYSFFVSPPVVLSPATLPADEVGLAYNQSITSTGGNGTVTLAVSGVTNTTGLTISGSGTGAITISGTPTSAGTVTFTVTPTDSVGTGAGQQYSITVSPAMVLTPAALPPGDIGLVYNQTITSTGGNGPVTLAVSGVTNTTGLTISGSGTGTITISGTPATAGTVTFTVTPTDSLETGAGRQYSITVNPPVVLSQVSLPPSDVGLAYNQSITTTGGSSPVTLAVSNVTNTTGLTISGSGTGTVTISGTPTSSGTVSFTVTPSDGAGTENPQQYSFFVSPAVVISPASLPAGEVGRAYSQTITSTGGTGPVTLAVSGVTNTTGLTISGSGTGTITLSGTPTSSGTITFTLTPTDYAGTGAGQQYSFTIKPQIVLGPATLPAAEVAVGYSHSITSTGGSGPVTLAVSGVTNTTGLTISGSGTGTITLSGAPTRAGTVTFTVTPSDSFGTRASTVYSFAVVPTLTLTRTTLPGGQGGQVYNQTIATTGGTSGVSLTVSGVSDPAGLTISGNGTGAITVSGLPVRSGTVTFTVTATDASGIAVTSTYAFTIRDKQILAAASAGSGTAPGAAPSMAQVAAAARSVVIVSDPQTGAVLTQLNPFGAYAGGVKVAVGDVNGDAYDDVIVVAGPGAINGLTAIYSGKDFSLMSLYYAFPGYAGAFNVAAGDLTGSGVADVIFSTATGADFVFAYAGASNSFIVSPFSAFGGFTGGVTVAAGDVTGSGHDEIIVGTASRVGAAGVFNQYGQLLQPYYLAPIPMNGVTVAAGDLNGDGRADLIFGATDSSLVLTFDGASGALMGYFFALPGQPYGVNVATVDPTGTGYGEIVAGFTGAVPAIAIYSGLSFQMTQLSILSNQPFAANGVIVSGSGSA